MSDDRISLSQLEILEASMTPGDWLLWTSNSVSRIGGPSGADEDVLCAVIYRDGVPDLLGTTSDLRGIVAFRNVMPAMLAIAKAALERQAAIDRDATDETRLLCEKRLLEAVRKVTE